ncbi:hypothetical protein OZN62_09640 [Aurantiacibacter sp. MUD11]|uniref:hypothetical protein n=1 Tax=Aurantiacibacter sp. MUD11 TaxID=3003265 RepID=UPI0022AAA308|nr:hypothetical protein [Aurantiacibacter sp. MUD11]WAT17195.1 hypothetical protein OZN62_09640 [Aurantiacibacter sp. MUD11]
MGEGLQAQTGNLAQIAVITSRPEALVIASALEHAGVPVWIDGMHHASVDPLLVALGGHRLRVPSGQYGEASDILREIGLPDAPVSYLGQRRAVTRFLALYVGTLFGFVFLGFLFTDIPKTYLQLPVFMGLGVQVDPRGPNEYSLAPRARD